MDEELFQELESNLEEAVEIVSGRSAPKTVYVVVTPDEIKAIRRKLRMSQSKFARAFQLSVETIKGWEQGKRRPDTAASNYLRVIAADPEFVRRALAT